MNGPALRFAGFRFALTCGAAASLLVTTACGGTSDRVRRLPPASETKTTASDAVEKTDGEASCKAAKRGLELANGVETGAFPAVVRIGRRIGTNGLSLCTGVFVSSTTLLTAAHCIDDTPNGGIMLLPGETLDATLAGATVAVRAFAAGPTGSNIDSSDPAALADDIAVVEFAQPVSTAFTPVATERPSAGTPATLVGYGITTLEGQPVNPDEDHRKRAGGNVVINPLVEGHPQIFTGGQTAAASAAANGGAAFGEHGDSGGPLLVGGEIAGVLSLSGVGERDGETVYFNTYTDLNGTAGRNFLAAAAAAGFALTPEAGVVDADAPQPAPDAAPKTKVGSLGSKPGTATVIGGEAETGADAESVESDAAQTKPLTCKS
jgi:hypothetical protein